MTINEITQPLKEKNKNLTFEEATNKAYEKLKKKTGFEGDISKPNELSEYFASYQLLPMIESNLIVGVKIEYSLLKHKDYVSDEEQRGSSKLKNERPAGSGSAPATHYRF